MNCLEPADSDIGLRLQLVVINMMTSGMVILPGCLTLELPFGVAEEAQCLAA